MSDSTSTFVRPSALQKPESHSSNCPVRQRLSRYATGLVVALILLTAARWIQHQSGALQASFTAPDAAAHYVTSLMIRDYVALGAPASPVEFAGNYYLHYPRVAFGIWPPLYHIAQAGWMLLVSHNRSGVLFFNALCSAVIGLMLFVALRPRVGFALAFAAGVSLLFLPLLVYVTGAVLADTFLTALIFAATLMYARYLDSGRMPDAVWFGLLASAAILTKYNGLALALLPVFAFALRPRPGALRRFSFWTPALIVAACCAPWYIANWHLVVYAMERGPSPEPAISSMSAAMFIALIRALGIPLLALAAIGVVTQLRNPDALPGLWISSIAAVCSVYAFHTLGYPSDDPRYLAGAIPPLLILAASGARRLSNLAPSAGLRSASAVALFVAAGAAAIFPIARRSPSPATSVAQYIVSRPEYRDSVVLIVSEDGATEGAVIAEIAMRENRPGHYVARSSKVLVKERIMGNDYQPVFATSRDLMTYIDSVPVGLVVLESPSGGCRLEHVCQMLEVMRAYPSRWRLVRSFNEAGRQIVVYELAGNVQQPIRKLAIDMKATLRHDLSTK